MILNPREMPSRNLYKLVTGTVVPRPIAWVSSTDGAGSINLAPFSYFNVMSSDPLVLVFSVGAKPDGSKKDTRRNVEATGEFVVNLVNEATAVAMNTSATAFEYGISEFEKSGLTPAPGVKIKVPYVAEAPVSYECTLRQIVEIGSNAVIFGDVQLIHVSDEIYDGNYVDIEKLRPIGRLAGNSYCRVNDLFELVRK
jgi:flavin reductase (DIM6/NTAB) family NADH-FMN oxidoreductase RutF